MIESEGEEGSDNLQCCNYKVPPLEIMIDGHDYSSSHQRGYGDGKQVLYDESDHNTECSVTWNAYSYSKVKAEEATKEFLESLPEEER